MSEQRATGPSGHILSRALTWAVAVALICVGAMALDLLVDKRIEKRLEHSLRLMTESYVGHAQALLDFGLPLVGEGSIAQSLQLPPSIAIGPDALSLVLKKAGLGEARAREISLAPQNRDGKLTVTQQVLDSHGEPVAKLSLSRSMEGLEMATRSRLLTVAGLILVVALILGAAQFYHARSQILVATAVIGSLLVSLVQLSFLFEQSAVIFRQTATVSVTETAADFNRAAGLGIGFTDLVGVNDYLMGKLRANSALDSLSVTAPDGYVFLAKATAGRIGSTLVTSIPVAAWLVDLDVKFALPSGVLIDAAIAVQPILTEIGGLAALLLVFLCGTASLLWLCADEHEGEGALPSAAMVSGPAGLLFALFGAGQLASGSALSQAALILLTGAALVVAFLAPRRLKVVMAALAAVLLLAAPLFDTGLLAGGLGLMSGLSLKAFGRFLSIHHLLAALLAPAAAICLAVLAVPAQWPIITGLSLVLGGLGLACLLLTPAGGETFARARVLMGVLGGFWSWVSISTIHACLLLLLVVTARREAEHVAANPLAYVLFAWMLVLAGQFLAAMTTEWRLRARWIAFELSVIAAVILFAGSHMNLVNGLVSGVMAAVLAGSSLSWSATLPFAAPSPKAGATIVHALQLPLLAGMLGYGLWLDSPEEAALPAVVIALIALAPLAFAVLAAANPSWRIRRRQEAPDAA